MNTNRNLTGGNRSNRREQRKLRAENLEEEKDEEAEAEEDVVIKQTEDSPTRGRYGEAGEND